MQAGPGQASSIIRRIRVAEYGGPERLTVVEEAEPRPALGEVRVHTVAAGVSYPDLLIREGTYPGGPKPPFTPGYDVVGVVDKLGPGATGFTPGEMVAAITVFGSYADAGAGTQKKLPIAPAGSTWATPTPSYHPRRPNEQDQCGWQR